jgi:hypothetical protein
VGESVADNLGVAWSRSVILYDRKKGPKYGFKQKIPRELVMSVKEHGVEHRRIYDSGIEEVYFTMYPGDLRRLKVSGSRRDRKPASFLDDVMRANPSDHIEDEKHILESCCIMTGYQNPGEIRYSVSSNRVSVKWSVKTNREEDAIVWVLIAPPRDRRKRRRAMSWLRAHSQKTENVRTKLNRFRQTATQSCGQPSDRPDETAGEA